MTRPIIARRLAAPAAVLPYSRQKVGRRWDDMLAGDNAPGLSRTDDS